MLIRSSYFCNAELVNLYAFSVTPITILQLATIYVTPHFETFAAVSKHCVAQMSPRSALPKDTTTKVDKDANFTILTSEMYRKVNELKAENWRVQKTSSPKGNDRSPESNVPRSNLISKNI